MPIHPARHVPIAWKKVVALEKKVVISWEKVDMTFIFGYSQEYLKWIMLDIEMGKIEIN